MGYIVTKKMTPSRPDKTMLIKLKDWSKKPGKGFVRDPRSKE